MWLNSKFMKKEKTKNPIIFGLGQQESVVKGMTAALPAVAAVEPPLACLSSVFGYLMHPMSLSKYYNSINQYDFFFFNSGTCAAFFFFLLHCS